MADDKTPKAIVVLDAETAGRYARRIARAEAADGLLAEAAAVIAHAARTHDRRICRCQACGMCRRIRGYLGRQP